jgi:DNA-binding response OmpR family regulator
MTTGTRSKVLCVEDNQDECDLVIEILADFEVICVPTVEEGCSMLDTTEFALVIMDEHLPDGSGLRLCGQFSRKNPTTPIIVISGDPYITTAEALAAGAKAFIAKSKPTYVEDLRHLVRAHTAAAHG